MWIELNVGKHKVTEEDKLIYIHLSRLQAVEKTYVNPNNRRDYDEDGDSDDYQCVPRVHVEGVGEYYVYNKSYEELKSLIASSPAILRTGGNL